MLSASAMSSPGTKGNSVLAIESVGSALIITNLQSDAGSANIIASIPASNASSNRFIEPDLSITHKISIPSMVPTWVKESTQTSPFSAGTSTSTYTGTSTSWITVTGSEGTST